MSVVIKDFYIFPAFGRPLNEQWTNLRESFGALNAFVRNGYIDESTNMTTHVLTALAYGELAQRFRFRWFYDKDADSFLLQQNTATEANPTWVTRLTIRESDGRLTINSPGGLLATGGFYNLGGLSLAETATGGDAFSNVASLLVNSGDGFYLTESSSGIPILNVSAAAASGTVTDGANLGSGRRVFSQKVGASLQFRTLTPGSNVTLTENANDITITSADTGETNTASNLGSGEGVWFDKQGVDLRFKSILAGSGINLSATSSEITLANTLTGLYAVTFRESQSGGRVEKDDTLVFHTPSGFYLGQAGNDGKPLLSFHDHVEQLQSTSIGDQSLISSDSATGAGHAVTLKRLTAGAGTLLSSDSNQVTVSCSFYPGLIVRETDGTPAYRDIRALSFLSEHFYVTQNSPNTDEAIVALREGLQILIRESEKAGYSKPKSALVFNSDSFYVDDNNSGQALVSLKSLSDLTSFADAIQRKNALINGGFDVWQRGTSFNQVDNFAYTADRWQFFYIGSLGVDGVDVDRSSVVPKDNTTNTGTSAFSCLVTVDTADASVAGDEAYFITQAVEGFNAQRFGLGTPDIQPIALSFWVRSSVTGPYSVFFRRNKSGSQRSYIVQYNINAANTWEKKSITLMADRGGSWNFTANIGMVVGFVLAAGSSVRTNLVNTWQTGTVYAGPDQVNFLATAGNTIYFSRIQLEVGTQATDFERRLIGEEIQLCQRYFAKTFRIDTTPANGQGTTGAVIGKSVNGGGVDVEPLANWFLPVTMRTSPTVTTYNTRSGGAPGQWQVGSFGDTSNARVISTSETIVVIDNTGVPPSGSSAQQAYIHIVADAEL